MKKIRLFSLLILMATLALLVLIGCQKEANIVSVSLKDHDPDEVIEMAVGEFDYDAYPLLVSYDTGSTEEIALSADMIAQTDLFKFYQVGEHDVTLSYSGYTYVFKISVKRATFGELAFPANNVFTYDGKAHTVEVEGDIPANAVVTYPAGNSFINAGTYDVTAIISCDGYVTERCSTTVTVERATYDMSGVTFEAKEFVYDGNSHSVAIKGVLPEGVPAPVYTINEKQTASAVDVGEYTVKAHFVNRDPNYESIPPMETTLTITPAEYTVKGVDIIFRSEEGKLIEGRTKTYDGTSVTFDLNDYNKLSNKLSVAFSVYDQDGKLISNANKKTNIINAGVYTVKVEFTLADGKNYQPIAPIVRTFEVTKRIYNVDYVTLDSNSLVYDNKLHALQVEGLPENVSVSYEYYLNGQLVMDGDKPAQSVSEAGRYTVKPVFTHKDPNYIAISNLQATLNIEKLVTDIFQVGFLGSSFMEYSGQSYEPSFITWQEVNKVEYDILTYSTLRCYRRNANGEYVAMGENARPTEIGSYRFEITITIADEYANNYTLPSGKITQILSVDFEIRKEIALYFTSDPPSTYTGEGKAVTYTYSDVEAEPTATVRYFRYDEIDGYVALADGHLPTDAGTYRAVVTVTIDDSVPYYFANAQKTAEFSTELVIEKLKIDVTDAFREVPTYQYANMDLQTRSFEIFNESVGGRLNCSVIWLTENQNGDWYIPDYSVAVNAGYYSVQYHLTPKNSNNVVLVDNGIENNYAIAYHRFYIA